MFLLSLRKLTLPFLVFLVILFNLNSTFTFDVFPLRREPTKEELEQEVNKAHIYLTAFFSIYMKRCRKELGQSVNNARIIYWTASFSICKKQCRKALRQRLNNAKIIDWTTASFTVYKKQCIKSYDKVQTKRKSIEVFPLLWETM